jgi:formate dehydrogenase beta subunit
MPAFKWEVEEAIKEGVGIHNSWGPKKIEGEEGKVKAVELMRCTSVFDEDGKFNPKYDPDTTKILEAEDVILAIGQSSDFGFLEKLSFETAGGLLRVDKNTFAASLDGIFAGGEIVSGPASVIESIASGKKAASSIDKHLGGDGRIDAVRLEPEKPNPWLGREEGFADRKRPEMTLLPLDERKSCFKEIELGFDEEAARSEAARCLQCDLRLYFSPITLPPEKWIEFSAENVEQAPAADGVYILLDETKNVICITGTQNMQEGLKEQLKSADKARYFGFEEDKMYTKRESELLQQHLQKHGKLPELNDELEDLF